MPRIAHELTGKKRYIIEPDVSDQEYHAIGRVTTQWALLEHTLYSHSVALAKAAKIEPPKDTRSASFKRRLRAFRLMVEEFVSDAKLARRLGRIISRVANAEQDRHRITHGLWEWDAANPDRVKALSFRPDFEFEKHFDFEAIDELARRIGAINFELIYPGGCNDGLADYANAHAPGTYGGTSRHTYLWLKERGVLVPRDRGKAKPPKGKPPRSSSKG